MKKLITVTALTIIATHANLTFSAPATANRYNANLKNQKEQLSANKTAANQRTAEAGTLNMTGKSIPNKTVDFPNPQELQGQNAVNNKMSKFKPLDANEPGESK